MPLAGTERMVPSARSVLWGRSAREAQRWTSALKEPRLLRAVTICQIAFVTRDFMGRMESRARHAHLGRSALEETALRSAHRAQRAKRSLIRCVGL